MFRIASERTPVTIVSAAVVAALALSGCGDDATDTAAPSEASVTTSSSTSVVDRATVAEIAGLEGYETVDGLEQREEEDGRVMFSWSPVERASEYRLNVLQPDGDPFWSESTTETRSVLGGGAPEDGTGTYLELEDGMTWSVLAIDADGNVVATSVVMEVTA